MKRTRSRLCLDCGKRCEGVRCVKCSETRLRALRDYLRAVRLPSLKSVRGVPFDNSEMDADLAGCPHGCGGGSEMRAEGG